MQTVEKTYNAKCSLKKFMLKFPTTKKIHYKSPVSEMEVLLDIKIIIN